MESETLAIRAEERLSMFHRRFLHPFKGFHLVFVLSCILFCVALCGSCSTENPLVSQSNEMQDPLDCDAHGSNVGNHEVGLPDFFVGDISSNNVQGNFSTYSGLNNVCTNSAFFCFPSTLPGFLSEEVYGKTSLLEVPGSQADATLPDGSVPYGMSDSNSSQLLDHGIFKLVNGRLVSCSLNSGKELFDISSPQNNNVQNDLASCRGYKPSFSSDESSLAFELGSCEGSLSPHIEITPSLLDWGQSYLFSPSLAFLTVANTCNDSIIHVYEPFSTDTQFYPCNFDDMLLGPGEVASITFVFLPRFLGLSSAHIVLQTSSGGFLVHAKGLAIESPYGIQPLLGLDVSSSGRFSKNLSLHNPFDETLFVQEVTGWISVSSGNRSYSAEAVCRMDSSWGSDQSNYFLNFKEWLDVRIGEVGLPLMGIRPHRNWEVNPRSTETILETDFSPCSEGKLFGALRVRLQGSSREWTDTVIVPFEAEVHGKAAYSEFSGLVSVSLETLMPCDSGETIDVALSLRNGSPYLLSVVKISEVAERAKLFQIKYMEGLILFPGSVTRIAVISYTPLVDSQDPPPKIPNLNSNCKLHVLTNDSGSSQIEIPCQDIVRTCLRHQPGSYIGYNHHPGKDKSGNTGTGFLTGGIQSSSQLKTMVTAEADEWVLKNWRSQGTTSGMSVLDDHEILFPMIQVGTHYSKWITVKNPSQQPVIMQLVLNSGVIIDQCRAAEEFWQPSLSSSLVQNESTMPTPYGFSIAESAITEAYVHPYGRAYLGPIVFYPSNRCEWRSSALVRNNLSGVEWLPLRGFGGSLSLVLLEGSEPVQSLEFNIKMPNPLNISPPELLFHREDTRSICSRPLSKELHAKNTGDLPLEVRRIEVSGTECQLDGFMVHTCKGFALEPGESMGLQISYKTDFSTAVVHRDLELVLASGIFVIPMKASLPMYLLKLCKKSLFWVLLMKFSLVVFIAASLSFLVFCCIFPQLMALVSFEYLFKSERSSIATIGTVGKLSRKHRNQRNSRFSKFDNMEGIFKSVREDDTSKLGFLSRWSDCLIGNQEQDTTAQHTKLMLDDQEQTIDMSDPQMETPLLSSSSVVKSVAVVEGPGLLEPPQTGNLTVRTGKEKGRRRRKRRGAGAGAGLTGLLEVSSSQSGNSTPSSPLSPVTSSTPERTWLLSPDVGHAIEAKNRFARVADQSHEKGQILGAATEGRLLESGVSSKNSGNSCLLSAKEQPSVARKTTGKPVLLPSATFPSAGGHAPCVGSPPTFLASTSAIAPQARAPGSKLLKEACVKAEEKKGFGNEFTYDIWGDHFSGFQSVGWKEELSTMIPNASEDDSQSFFMRGPQIVMQKSLAISESPASKLPNYPVSCLHQNG